MPHLLALVEGAALWAVAVAAAVAIIREEHRP